MRNISEPSRHRAPIATSRRRWDPRSVGSRPHRRLRLRHRFFESVVFIDPWELEAHLGTKRTTKPRAFRWFKFHGHASTTPSAVSESVRAIFRTSTSNFRISRVRQPFKLGVRSPSLAQKNDNVKSFYMVQIRWAYDTDTKSSQRISASCISLGFMCGMSGSSVINWIN